MFNIMGFIEKFDFVEFCKKPKYRVTSWLKGTGRGIWQFSDLWGAWQKRGRADVFEGRLVPQCVYVYILDGVFLIKYSAFIILFYLYIGNFFAFIL